MKDSWILLFITLWIVITLFSYTILGWFGVIFSYFFTGILISLLAGSWKVIFAWLPALVDDEILEWCMK